MALRTIPISDAFDQQFTITLEGTLYTMRLRLNYRMALWTLDLLTQDGDPIVYGVPLAPSSDLFAPYALSLEGSMFALNLNSDNDYLSIEKLTDGGNLFYATV